MPTKPRLRSTVLLGALGLTSIAACGGSAVVDKPGGMNGNAPGSAAGAERGGGTAAPGAGAGGTAAGPGAGGTAAGPGAGGTAAGPGAGGTAAASGSNEPAQGGCCNVALPCNSGDQTLWGPAECPTGAECYSRPLCCNVTRCAHWPLTDGGTAQLDGGPEPADAEPADSGACSLLGSWHTHSDPWNNQSTDALINFTSDGTLSGTPAFVGKWEVDGSQLTIHDTVGADMTCAFADHWTLTFSQDCQTAPLLPIGSGCTGARRYLDWNVTLTRN